MAIQDDLLALTQQRREEALAALEFSSAARTIMQNQSANLRGIYTDLEEKLDGMEPLERGEYLHGQLAAVRHAMTALDTIAHDIPELESAARKMANYFEAVYINGEREIQAYMATQCKFDGLLAGLALPTLAPAREPTL